MNAGSSQVLRQAVAGLALAVTCGLTACEPDVAVSGPTLKGPYPWTFIVLPDTQATVGPWADVYYSQTQWIAAQSPSRRIRFVLHVGDVVFANTEIEWQRARHAMGYLDGHVPYAMVPGNHDYGFGGKARDRNTLMGQHFPAEVFERDRPHVAFFEPGRVDNSAHVFDTPSGPWLVLALEFGPRPEVVQWANEQAQAHAHMPAILLTHAYLHSDAKGDSRYDIRAKPGGQSWSPYLYELAAGGVSDGQQLWVDLVRRQPNISLVVCGHTLNDGVGRQTSQRPDRSVAHELLANFQMIGKGGDGFFRIMEVHADRIEVRTFSPWLNRYKRTPEHEFTLFRSAALDVL